MSDVNQNAARIVRESTSKLNGQPPSDFETAWLAWSSSIANVDERTLTLLRAAFEAGAEAATTAGSDGRNPAAVVLNKLGASKGGKARAEKLSPAARQAIAKKAAAKRWGN